LVTGVGASAQEDFGDVVWGVKRQECGRAVKGVGDTDTIGDIGQPGLSVSLDVVDGCLVISGHEDFAIRKGKNSREKVCGKSACKEVHGSRNAPILRREELDVVYRISIVEESPFVDTSDNHQ